MAKRIGSTVQIHGMKYTIYKVVLDGSKFPTFILKRNWDGSFWRAKSRAVTRFTHLYRIFDSANANFDKYDVLSSANEVLRRM